MWQKRVGIHTNQNPTQYQQPNTNGKQKQTTRFDNTSKIHIIVTFEFAINALALWKHWRAHHKGTVPKR